MYLFFAAVTVGLFAWVQWSGKFPDPDTFYHARVAELIRVQGPVHDFPWLAKTVFADSYVDHHFLYHVLLIPFLMIARTPEQAMQISVFAFGTFVVLGGLFLLRRLRVGTLAFVAPILFLISNPLVFRLNLAKAPAISLVTLFFGTYAALKRRPIFLGFISFVYVWLYDGWVILPVLVSCVVLSNLFLATKKIRTALRFEKLRIAIRESDAVLLLGSTFLGIALGHFINPYFPENFHFEWLHIVRIGLAGFQKQIGVGAEWYPYGWELFAITSSTIFVFAFGLISFFSAFMRSKETGVPLDRSRVRDTLALYFFASIAMVFAMRSKRNVEYFVPFAVLAGISALDLAMKAQFWKTFWKDGEVIDKKWRIGFAVFVVYLVSMMGIIAVRDLEAVRKDFDGGISATRYAGISAWLDAHTPQDSLIFHDEWDSFPQFFLHSTHNRWMVGLDPAFWYVKDPAHFDEWVQMTRGKITDDMASRVKNDFGASYVLIDTKHPDMKKAFDEEKNAVLLYSDADGYVYGIKE